MPEDNYSYQQKPLPPINLIGSDTYQAGSVTSPNPVTGGGTIPIAPQVTSPFDTGGYGSGGGGGAEPDCSTTWQIGTVLSNGVSFPCDGSNASYVDTDGFFFNNGTNSVGGSRITGILRADVSSKSIQLDPAQMTTDGPVALPRELDVCHAGAAGKRVFICSVSYAA